MELNKIYLGDNIETLKSFPDESIDCCITSPPYYGLRDYGTGTWVGGDPECPHRRMNKYSESTSTGHAQEELRGNVGDAIYKTVCPLCGAVREDKQVGLEETPEDYVERLVNIFREVKRVLKPEGTLWVNIGDSYMSTTSTNRNFIGEGGRGGNNAFIKKNTTNSNLKVKDLIGVPWMLAFALRNDGWYLRQDIVWCLSGGTYLYVKSQKGVSPMMVKDMIRLKPENVQLWNGQKWVNVLGWGKSTDTSEKLEIILRSGERIQCTGGHKWVLEDGTEKIASELSVGDILMTTNFEDVGVHSPSFLTKDVLWLIGLYIAQGSKADDCIQIALHANKIGWVDRIKSAVKSVGGTTTYTLDGNRLNVRIYSQVFLATLHQYLGGTNAKTKHLNNICWQMPNKYLKEIMVGYLDGDGHWDADNNRWRLGFTRNYDWERDLRLLANRLDATLTLKISTSYIGDKSYPSFRGEWRWESSEHHNRKNRTEIVEIKPGCGRNYYDISVDCDNHLFALASGVLTHNCKPNPMPESTKDRCTKAHEYIFLLSKQSKYYFNNKAIQEPCEYPNAKGAKFGGNKYGIDQEGFEIYSGEEYTANGYRNKRDVWSVSPSHYSEAHFATYPEELVQPMVAAGCPKGGVVLDPFMGSGTTAVVAKRNGCNYVGCELNPDYIEMANRRIATVPYRLF